MTCRYCYEYMMFVHGHYVCGNYLCPLYSVAQEECCQGEVAQ